MTLDLAIDDRVMIDTEFDCAIQELDMLFNTTNTELIGKPEYGTNFEQFLWQLTPSTVELRKYIREKIDGTYFASQYDIDIDVRTDDGTLRDIYYVEITFHINDDEKIQQKTHRVYMLT